MADSLRQRVLDTIQSSFPLEHDPYASLGERLSAPRDDVKEALSGLCLNGSVRRVGASFDSRMLGYKATLCALAVPGDEFDLERAAEVVNAFPGITHNYGRAHRYNLWFTLIARSDEEKSQVLDLIRERTGCTDLLDMPATRKFKISVDFGAQRAATASGKGGPASVPAAGSGSASNSADADVCSAAADVRPFDAEDPFDIAIVRWAQDDIVRDERGNLVDEPYDVAAGAFCASLGQHVCADQIIERLAQLRQNGTIRRFGAMVRHQRIGFSYNSMTVWDIPDDEVEAAGMLFASMPFVSHCYTRPRAETWPANLYAMTHATSPEEMESNVETLREALEGESITCRNQFALETTREYKKVSMSYFMPTHIPFSSEFASWLRS